MAFGQESKNPRFIDAVANTQKIHELYPNAIIDSSGHSLGSRVMTYVAENLGRESWMGKMYGYNGGTSPLGKDGVQRIFSTDPELQQILKDKIVNIRQEVDGISLTPARYGTHVTYRTTSNPIEAHKLDSFLQEGKQVMNAGEKFKLYGQTIVDSVGEPISKQLYDQFQTNTDGSYKIDDNNNLIRRDNSSSTPILSNNSFRKMYKEEGVKSAQGTHTMPDGTVMSGTTHSDKSVPVQG